MRDARPDLDISPIGEGWFAVSDSAQGTSIEIRARWFGTQARIVGIRLDGEQPVTGADLRAVPIGRLNAAMTNYLASLARELAELNQQFTLLGSKTTMRPGAWNAGPDHLTDAEAALWEIAAEGAMLNEIAGWVTPKDEPDAALSSRGRGAKPPSDGEYESFASMYRRELAHGRGAKQRVATTAGINRSTVYRWIKECQRRGLLREDES